MNIDDLLIKSAKKGFLYGVRYALENGANNYLYKDLALFYAAEINNYEIVKYLAEMRVKDGMYAPVEVAARNGHFKIVKYLIEKGFDFNNYALAFAAKNGHFEIVKYLVEKGTNLCTLFGAVENGHLEVVKYLIEKGADWKITDEHEYDLLSYAKRSKNQAMIDYIQGLFDSEKCSCVCEKKNFCSNCGKKL